MKYLLIAIVLLVGCSKDSSSVKPSNLAGNWTFNTPRASGDFTISYPYKVNKGGKFTIDGVQYTTADLPFNEIDNGYTTITLRTEITGNGTIAYYVQFAAIPSSDFSKIEASNLNIQVWPKNSESLPDKFTVTRK